jgi:hypothetical protein
MKASTYNQRAHRYRIGILLVIWVGLIFFFPSSPILGADQKINSKSGNSFVPQNDRSRILAEQGGESWIP